ncbi:MAG: hypothetical protein IID40_01650 [Planctomycetes bacterium]|nr:hypothetical protein [Planctomycetota bacterium]
MKRPTATLPAMASLGLLVLLGGCEITGTWRAVRTEPAEAEGIFPIRMVTFSPEGDCSVTRQSGQELITSTGSYEWTGTKLTITPTGQEPRVYPGRLDPFTKRLQLSHQADEQKVTVWLEREPDPAK